MTRILIATHNKKKREELNGLLKDFKDVEVLIFDDLKDSPPIVVEDGNTFRQNAIKKSVIGSKFFSGLVLADDSGLEVDALGGKPGVRSARFASPNATDFENNKKLLNLLLKVPDKERGARFVCHISLSRNGRLLEDFEGTVKGKIITRPRGRNGFGYDPIFMPQGYDITFAEMEPDNKNKISHRAEALRKLKDAIQKYLEKTS